MIRFGRKHLGQEGTAEERWSTKFRGLRDSRFANETQADYSTRIRPGALTLTVSRSDCFAWTESALHRYRDAIFVADLVFAGAQCAAGLLIRKTDEHSYYYVLVGSDGRFRFDLVFNGNPTPLLAWTECPSPAANVRSRLQVIARGAYFAFILDDVWIGEVVDDSIASGTIAFAVQNYEQSKSASVALHSLSVESRPIEIEAGYYAWTKYLKVEADRRITLARTLLRMGQFASSGVQIRKAARSRELSAEEHFMLGESLLNGGDPAAALKPIEDALMAAPDFEPAIVEKANLLYLEDRQIELSSYFDAHLEILSTRPGMWNLFGNCLFALSEWRRAKEAYAKAIALQDDVALFHANLGRCMERLDAPEAAKSSYLRACQLFVQDEAYDEIDRLLARLDVIAKGSKDVLAIKGRMAFAENRFVESERQLQLAIDLGSDDSSVFCLLGILRVREGDRHAADLLFERSVELEPDYPVYQFRFAENRFLADMDVGEAIERAVRLAPEDGWVRNLAGLHALRQERFHEACIQLRIARTSMPDEATISANLGEALYGDGKEREALHELEMRSDDPSCLVALGRIHAKSGRLSEAIEALRGAVSIDPDNEDYREELASALFEDDEIHQAEEIIHELLEITPTSGRLNLMAQIAAEKGEYRRAEASWAEAIRLEPANLGLKRNLTAHFGYAGEWKRAIEMLEGPLSDDESGRTAELRERARVATGRRIECAGCGREWWAPKHVDSQPQLKLRGEPPDESPAGQCPTCAAIYCVECAAAWLDGGRFHCASCGENLNLNDDHLKYLVARYVG